MIVKSARILLPLGLAISVLPLALTGCGNTGTGASIKENAFLTPPPLENKPTVAVATEKNSAEMGIKAASDTKPSKEKNAEPIGPQLAEKSAEIKTTKAVAPPVPVRRPNRKVRRKKVTARLIEEQKSAVRKTAAKKAEAKQAARVEKRKIQARAVPVKEAPHITKSVKVVKAPKAEMVPEKAVGAQVASDDTPQDIVDAFKEDMGVKALEQMAIEEDVSEKVAKVESVPIEPRFGQSEYRFSGQQ